MCAALIAVHAVFMLVHVVMWKLKEFACGASRQENAQKMKEKLEALVGVVPQLKSATVGVDFKHTDMSYDAVLISRFESEEDLAAYKTHPAHVAISTFCKEIREGRVVVDYWE